MGDVELLDPAAFPGAGIDPDAVRLAADDLARSAETIRQGGADVLAEWRRLAQHYEAPEAYRLIHALDPVETESRAFADDLGRVAAALRRYADDVVPVLEERRSVSIDAERFLARIAEEPSWRYEQSYVDAHMGILRRANEVQVLLWDAERRCANAILACCGGRSWRASTGTDDERGHGWASIPDDAAMPWGAEVRRQDPCPVAAVVQAKRFAWDGVIWDGLLGGLKGTGALAGVGDESDGSWGWSHSWSAAGAAWTGMTSLVGHRDGQWSATTAGDSWKAMGQGLLAWEHWDDDPARASGGVFSAAVPGVAAVRVFGRLAKVGRAGSAERGVAQVLDPTGVADDVARVGEQAVPRGAVAEGVSEAADGAVRQLEEVAAVADQVAELAPPEGKVLADWTVRTPNAPLAPRDFLPPTNPPQPPPRFINPGAVLRIIGPTPQYPHGYWRLKEDGHFIDPRTGEQARAASSAEFQAKTHVPLPPDWLP